MDHEIWGDPGNFRPERWIDENGKLRSFPSFIPFGIGKWMTPRSLWWYIHGEKSLPFICWLKSIWFSWWKDNHVMTSSWYNIFFSLSGKRACAGESLARMEIFLFSVSLIQRFKFKMADKRPSLIGSLGVTLVPKPFKIIAESVVDWDVSWNLDDIPVI